MTQRVAKFTLFALVALYSAYSLFNIVVRGRTHLIHAPRVWVYFADRPWIVSLCGVIYLIAIAASVLLCYEALAKPATPRAGTRPQTNVTAPMFFRALLSSYLRPGK